MRRSLKIGGADREYGRARGLVRRLSLLRGDRYRGSAGSGCTAIGDLDPPRAGVRWLAATSGAAVRLREAGEGRLDHAQEARQKHQRNGEATNHRGTCQASFGRQFADKFPYPALGVNSAMRRGSQPAPLSPSKGCLCREVCGLPRSRATGRAFAQDSVSDSSHATEFPLSCPRLGNCPAISSR